MTRKRNKQLFGRSGIILGVTASIAAYKAAELVSRLKQEGADVHVVLTPDAGEFITPLTFQSLSGNPVHHDIFGQSENFNPAHIALAERGDLILVAPATADFIGRVAGGLADDLLSAAIMSASVPVLFAPAMNRNMYRNAIVQDNIKKLKKYGYHFVGPESGYLACGYEGIGRLASAEKILAKIKSLLALK